MLKQSKDNTGSVYISRIDKLSTAMTAAGMKAIILNPGPSLVYLTGLHFHLSERPVITIFIPYQPPSIILPEFEAGKTQSLPFDFKIFPYPEDPSRWADIVKQGLSFGVIGKGPIGVETRQLRYLEMFLLQESAPELGFMSADDVLASLRMYKDELEINAMQEAVNIAQKAFLAVAPHIAIGKSEQEIASNLIIELIQAGSEIEMAFSPIVSGGPNSANPHATPGSRELASGDLLVIDWGASFIGYISDITRTFAIGDIDKELQNIATIVKDANEAARSIVRPGICAKEVDKAARSIIENSGYGEYFLHRTGHGIGLEGHEEPYIRGDNDLILREGMTFTIEPGVYLPGQGGVRIEDDVYVTKDGCKSLTNLPRELFRVL
jgi:Xaa-Pro dipeptidase